MRAIRYAASVLVPRSVGVIGGGTAGYFAALAIKRRFPDLAVTIVESSTIPIIGVGEATTTLMPPFLHTQLGLSAVDLFKTVNATFKLGIKFEWGPQDEFFTYPFGDAHPFEAFAYDGHLRDQSLMSMLMTKGRAPLLRTPEGDLLSLLPRLKFAYHLDNASFVGFLAAAARDAGIRHEDVVIDRAMVRPSDLGIESLGARDGRELRFDFYVDASGFRSLLLENALGSPFSSYASSLFCDRAIVATVQQSGEIQPYTTAETMNAGWCWRIPVRAEDHRGYVFSSAFLGDDEAEAEMRRNNPTMGAASLVRFRSGRHREFWIGNTVAVGNAYGFVEPLESTALHMVIIELAWLLDGLEAMRAGSADEARAFVARANDAIGAHWDYLRWFLAVHYKFNARLDTPFWRAARADVDVSGLAAELDRFTREGPYLADGDRSLPVGDPSFHYSGLMMLLLGQRAPTTTFVPSMSRDAWSEKKRKEAFVAGRALGHREALRALAEDPRLLTALTETSSSWVRGPAERARTVP